MKKYSTKQAIVYMLILVVVSWIISGFTITITGKSPSEWAAIGIEKVIDF